MLRGKGFWAAGLRMGRGCWALRDRATLPLMLIARPVLPTVPLRSAPVISPCSGSDTVAGVREIALALARSRSAVVQNLLLPELPVINCVFFLNFD
ncbi:MAG TPA: hypothetical protein DD001_06205 [Microcoleaceae bacterium UBA10368]|nr:hypothetical protein [Microcoleaceae cyanobacterium UBA10368]HCV29734.1 hypothetical protein [Microcoleaceae cyanobacterium UBA9251]